MATSGRRITKKNDTSRLIWFEKTNQWVYLKNPAYYIYCLFSKRESLNSISLKTAKKYKLSKEIAVPFVNEIISGLTKLLEPIVAPKTEKESLNLPAFHSINYFFCHSYLINGRIIKLYYEDSLCGYYIHSLFQHLEIKYGGENSFIEFEVFNFNQDFILRIKNLPEKYWGFKESPPLKRQLFTEISNSIYGKEEKDWMSFLHASAVTNGKETILFSSASGSGKSTLAALLYERGLQMVSDDFVPIDAKLKRAFPFPAAISIKETAFHLFSAKELTELRYQELKNKSVKFLNPEISGKAWYKAHKIKKIVFVSYKPGASFKMSRLPLHEALKLFYEQASIDTSYENTKRFIDWFVKVECFVMEYSDNEKAIMKIKSLFKE